MSSTFKKILFSQKQKVSSGGGSGGGPYSLVTHASANGASSITTLGKDTTGGSLIIIELSWFSSTSSVSVDNKGNNYTALNQYHDHGGNYLTQLFYCLNPVVGPSHTFTANANLLVMNVAVFSGGTPAYDGVQNGLIYGGGNTTSWQPGSVTPNGDNRLIVTASTWNDTSTTPIASIDSSFSITDQAQERSDALYGGLAYKIQTVVGAENPTYTFSNIIDVGSAAIAVFK
jgi:hypothetical protein